MMMIVSCLLVRAGGWCWWSLLCIARGPALCSLLNALVQLVTSLLHQPRPHAVQFTFHFPPVVRAITDYYYDCLIDIHSVNKRQPYHLHAAWNGDPRPHRCGLTVCETYYLSKVLAQLVVGIVIFYSYMWVFSSFDIPRPVCRIFILIF